MYRVSAKVAQVKTGQPPPSLRQRESSLGQKFEGIVTAKCRKRARMSDFPKTASLLRL